MLRNVFLLALAVCVPALLPLVFFDAGDISRHQKVAGTQQSKIEAVAAPGRAAAGGPGAPAGRKVAIDADARGHFVADFKLNGRRLTALVDTGATMVAMNRSTARRIGIALANSDFRHGVQTANGKARAAAATIGSVEIGRIFVRDVQALVLEDDALDGVLVGMSFLNRLQRFQVEDGRLAMQQ